MYRDVDTGVFRRVKAMCIPCNLLNEEEKTITMRSSAKKAASRHAAFNGVFIPSHLTRNIIETINKKLSRRTERSGHVLAKGFKRCSSHPFPLPVDRGSPWSKGFCRLQCVAAENVFFGGRPTTYVGVGGIQSSYSRGKKAFLQVGEHKMSKKLMIWPSAPHPLAQAIGASNSLRSLTLPHICRHRHQYVSTYSSAMHTSNFIFFRDREEFVRSMALCAVYPFPEANSL